MLATIPLPAGTDRVTVRKIPAYIADALHPALPDDTPRQITRLEKIPTTAANAENWCGAGCQPFPVSLTDEDMAGLIAGVWAKLPPLVLPISEPDWQPYLTAYQRNPPTDWELIPMARNPVLEAGILWHSANEEWTATVRQAAMQGHLTPRHPTTLLPQPQALGEWLLDCIVTVADLTHFLARFDIGVSVESHLAICQQSDLSAKKKADAGRYTLEEAVAMIEQSTGERAGEMLTKLMAAVGNGGLATYEPGMQARYQSETVREWYEEAYWDDLNAWLDANEPRIAWRFPEPTKPVQEVGAGGTAKAATLQDVKAQDWPIRETAKFKQSSFRNALSDVPKWLEPAIVIRGKTGKSSTLWNPAMIAFCLMTERKAGKGALTTHIRAHFSDWLAEWEKMNEQ